jgi:hypothetical protein
MKKAIVYILVITFFSCTDENKLYIKSVSVDSSTMVDWYFYSQISSFSRSYVQISTLGKDPINIFESFNISDIRIKSDTLTIEVAENDYKIYPGVREQNKIKLVVDTTGKIWNEASSRLGRLHSKKVDCSKPHFIDSYCPHGECY